MVDAGGALERVEALYAAINRGDLDTAMTALSEDVRWSRPPDAPVSGTLRGREQVGRMCRAFVGPLTAFEIEPTRMRALGEGVLAHVTFRGTATRGCADRSQFEFAGAQSFRLGSDGLVTEVREFRTVREGEADLG